MWDDFVRLAVAKANYWIYIVLMCIGLWGMIVKGNLVKKIIGMNILQTAIILFYVSIASKAGATLPIITHHGPGTDSIQAVGHINPLPHVLMLTAIVVAVGPRGVGRGGGGRGPPPPGRRP
jgi:multicomponent Na+:H+ antiporter subunit C